MDMGKSKLHKHRPMNRTVEDLADARLALAEVQL